ncbi:MAG TPA: cysteine desulfurase family protein [Candidatus Paceibacterota bacterium]|jgi:cysteine desulfurase|nr:cysteine desulfurase family protein [Candidatus Paceibacterota bacterium]HPC37409.1 cysteine desulfurase family protein [Candidatus Paceibacterota bacterium]HRU35784.1 cysteine desulfurase family protein [Candidatus Paceibacterota bacterium]
MKRIYLDYASTTPVSKEVIKTMLPYFDQFFGNPSAIYEEGRLAKKAIETARKQIADLLSAKPEEIIFTNGGTESINLAIFGIANFYRFQFSQPEIIISSIEHPAVLESAQKLEKLGFKIIKIEVNKKGMINLKQLENSLNKQTLLISIILANNEIGTIEPIKKIKKIVENFRFNNKTLFPIFHTDACQAAEYLDIKPKKLGVDLMSLNGGKIYGPKATGLLYKKEGIELEPIIFGGGQEKKYRSGTENVSGIVGLATALKLAQQEKEKESARLKKLRDYLINEVLQSIPKTFVNGDLKNRLPNNAHFTILDVEGEALILKLDQCGIAVSTGSACHSKSLTPSHVLIAIGLPHEVIHGSLRVTLGRYTTKNDIDYFLKNLIKVVKELRQLSPISLKFKNE